MKAPLVGGAFGGKTTVQLEILAYIASKSVGGKAVKMLNSREEDMITSPVHIGLDAKVKLGCTTGGKIAAAEITHLFDSGAYSDRGAIISRAAAVDCSGPYNIDNLWCDSLCLYTNQLFSGTRAEWIHLALHVNILSLQEELEKDDLTRQS